MNIRFEIEPDYADALRAAGLADFDALMNAPAGPPTSKHKQRETVPIEFDLNGKRQRFFLKRVFKVPGQHSWRPWLRGKPGYSQPAREWDNIKMMRDAGLPVMKRVAVGERRKFGIPTQAFVLVEDVGMQWTLENWLIPGFPKPPEAEAIDGLQLWYELGKLRRKFDKGKIIWPDVVAKHVFARPVFNPSDDESNWDFALIDVERAFIDPKPPLIDWDKGKFISQDELKRLINENRKRPIRKLNKLKHFLIRLRLGSGWGVPDIWNPLLVSLFPHRRSHGETVAFYNGEAGQPRDNQYRESVDPFHWLRGLFDALPLADSYLHPRADGSCWQNGVKASDKSRALLTRIGITDMESAFRLPGAHRLDKPGLQKHRDRLRLTTAEDGNSLTLFVKRFRRPPLREQFLRMLTRDSGHSTAYREYKTARDLAQFGIPTMNAIAIGEEMRGPLERRSFVVTMAVEGQSLELLAQNWKSNPSTAPSVRERWEIIERIAHLVSRMHSMGRYHRDLYLSHIYLARNRKGEFVTQVIDLGRMLHRPPRHVRPPRQGRWEIKDLAALAYSVPPGLMTRTDHLRFLRAQGRGGFGILDGRARYDPTRHSWRKHLLLFIQRINRRVAKMAKHDAKRAARLGLPHPALRESSNRPLAGSTNTQTANTPTE